MRTVGNVTQFVLNKSRRNRLEVQSFGQKVRIKEKRVFFNTIVTGRWKKAVLARQTADPEVELKAVFA
jgi:hypothetical protein